MMKTKPESGFTLVEIMIVVLIIGMVVAIAVPSFMKVRNSARSNACLNNLRNIENAKDTWAMECNIPEGEPSVKVVVDSYMKRPPGCPAGGGYTYNDLGEDPTCDAYNVATHNATM